MTIFIRAFFLALCLPIAVFADKAPVTSFKVAAVEFNPTIMAFEKNIPPLVSAAENAAKNGAKLIVLPELSNSGYLYNSREQINPYLDTIPGKVTNALEKVAKQYQTYIVVGISERDPITNLAYNSAALIGPNGYVGKYRKNQLNVSDTRWAARGNLGYPIFNTPLGKIAMVICYDDVYLQSLLMPSLRGANIIAYVTASDRLPLNQPGAKTNHSTIARVTTLPGWVGTYVVASTRTDNETNPATQVTTHYDGGASIWDPAGHQLAQAPVSPLSHPSAPMTIYATVDRALYDNPAKAVLAERRRPELYGVIALYRAPGDPDASTKSHDVHAITLQYTPTKNNKTENLEKIKTLLKGKQFNLLVLPENSLLGDGLTALMLKNAAETMQGDSVKKMQSLAKNNHAMIIFSMPEKENQHFYEAAIIIDASGNIIGNYHKTHLNLEDKTWATAGNDLPVFNTPLGRVGLMIGDEVRVPDVSTVMAVKRADIIAIPTEWHGEYGGRVETDPGLLIKPFPKNSMFMWFDVAVFSQTKTLVANYVGGPENDLGSSGLYSNDPVQGHFPPILADDKTPQAFQVDFATLDDATQWMNQWDYIIGRRPELITPEIMPMDSIYFHRWQVTTEVAKKRSSK